MPNKLLLTILMKKKVFEQKEKIHQQIQKRLSLIYGYDGNTQEIIKNSIKSRLMDNKKIDVNVSVIFKILTIF